MQYLYVCQFSNGHIKVGRTISPKERIASHASRVGCMGVSLDRHEAIECVGDVAQSEAALISWCRSLASKTHKNEWFVDVDFDLAVSEAKKQAAFGYLVPEECRFKKELNEAVEKKFFDLYIPKWNEMAVPFIAARLMRDAIVLQMDVLEADYEIDPRSGLSRFELLAAIYVSTADREGIASLFHEAVEAAASADLRHDLIAELSACALLDAEASGLGKTTEEAA